MADPAASTPVVDIPDQYRSPEMMAVGDSIFNGTRSLTTTGRLAELSPPALVARMLHSARFLVPDYPSKVLFDLERFWRRIGTDVDRMQREFYDECMTNAGEWLSDPHWSDFQFFDNLGIAGAVYETLDRDTGRKSLALATQAFERLRAHGSLSFPDIYSLYFHLNAAFLLNPSRDKDFQDLTALHQVALRQPGRLLINIGNNNGVFDAAATGSIGNTNAVRSIPEHASRLAEFLSRHCAGIKHIYFNLLIRPRVIANLAPREDGELGSPDARDTAGYYKRYIAVNFATGSILGPKLRAYDELVKSINEAVVTNVKKHLGKRVKFIDLYAWGESLDRKHGTEKHKCIVLREGKERRLSNYPIHVHTSGLFSLDNLHPTAPGYALLARRIARAIKEREKLDNVAIPGEPEVLQQAFDADSLLTDPPSHQHLTRVLFSIAGLGGLGQAFAGGA